MSIQKSELTELQRVWETLHGKVWFDEKNKPVVYGDTYFEFTDSGKRYRIGITEVKTKKKRVTKIKK